MQRNIFLSRCFGIKEWFVEFLSKREERRCRHLNQRQRRGWVC